ncbi:hypothetical protein ACFQZV_02905 [Microbacterium koreense]|uniref:Uncharacterized protein n=1 Tax=Microbacterium koreense TaxID=323761 RepID=A0ABW2ZNN2_9MICO
MEPLLAFLVDFWWIAPATAGAGAVGYSAVTARSRRARRIELDAARHEELIARKAVLAARADVRGAQAAVQAAQAQHGRFALGAPAVVAAKQHLQRAKQSLRSSQLAVRAARTRVKAVQARLALGTSSEPLPIETLMARHDAVTAGWLDYETDAAKALVFTQMSDARHPTTFAFLQAHAEAARLRPASVKAKVTPEQFVAYRDAVAAAEGAFAEAERSARSAAEADAKRAHREVRSPLPPRPPRGEVPPPAPAPPPRSAELDAGVWPVPGRTRGTGSGPTAR